MKKLHVHFMGIGGAGISAVAEIAKNSGFEISGCDLETSKITGRLEKEGVKFYVGHDKSHLKGVDILAHSPAVFYQNETHPEYLTAVKKGITTTWEDFMAQKLIKGKFLIAVAGTHGKGTTTGMMARVLEAANFDPTCEVGANLIDWGKINYRLGKSKYFLCEADEFREKFLKYSADIAVITTIEMDHPDYFKDFNAILIAFAKFAKKSKLIVINGEDPGCKQLLKTIRDVKGIKIIKYKSLTKSQAKLKLTGNHLRSDAGAVWTVAKALRIKDPVIKAGLESFTGLERRFEIRGEMENGAIVVDDYAHHPTAVAVNIQAAREKYPGKKIWIILQPHMYSRLATLFNEFANELKKADRVIVTDVFTRRELGVNKPTGKELANAVGPKATYVGGELLNVANFITRNSSKGDVILLMGAGNIYKVSDILLTK